VRDVEIVPKRGKYMKIVCEKRDYNAMSNALKKRFLGIATFSRAIFISFNVFPVVVSGE